jgi:hypothetical protein
MTRAGSDVSRLHQSKSPAKCKINRSVRHGGNAGDEKRISQVALLSSSLNTRGPILLIRTRDDRLQNKLETAAPDTHNSIKAATQTPIPV